MKKRLLFLVVIAIILMFIFNVYYFIFIKNGIVIPCIFHEITGFYCPGCGVTRMFLSLIKFDFYQAFRYNQLIFISLPFIIILVVDKFIKWIIGNPNYLYKKIGNKVWIILLIVTVFFAIIRNVPFFDYLIPTVV